VLDAERFIERQKAFQEGAETERQLRMGGRRFADAVAVVTALCLWHFERMTPFTAALVIAGWIALRLVFRWQMAGWVRSSLRDIDRRFPPALALAVAAVSLQACTIHTAPPAQVVRVEHVQGYALAPSSCGGCCSSHPNRRHRHPYYERERHVADYEPRRDQPKQKKKRKRAHAHGERRRAAWGLR
jgi:hypothetical protein